MEYEVKVKSPGESITEVMIAEWLKKTGDYVEMDEIICSLETDKATMELTAEVSGTLIVKVEVEEEIPVGTVIATIDDTGKPSQSSSKTKEETATESVAKVPEKPVEQTSYATGHPSPAAKKLMSEHQINPEQITATGKDGRITKSDVLTTMQTPKTQEKPKAVVEKPKTATKTTPAQPAKPKKSSGEEMRREKMSMLRRKIAARLVSVKNETAMLTTFNEVDMSKVIAVRNKYKELFLKKNGVKLGFMSFFTKAVCQALRDYPAVNSMVDGDHIVYFNNAHIGIAVSTPKGLVVPVIRCAQELSFAEIESQIVDYAVRARNRSLTIGEMEGGTFTITNGGIFGSMLSTPILNPPQSGILGMHNIVERPVAVDGKVEIHPMMYVALSYDHRVIDGKDSVGFLVRIKQILEDPYRFFLEI